MTQRPDDKVRRRKLSPAKEAAAMAELAQYAAIGVLIGGITLFVLGHEHVIADWLAVVVGAPVCAAGVLLFWRAVGRAAEASEAIKAERAAAPSSRTEPPREERD